MMTKIHPSWLEKKPIAHRGLHLGDSTIPENSMKAFENAIEKGYPIELDVHVIADSNIIVFHDNNLSRMCGIDQQVDEISIGELDGLTLKGSEEKIPLLSEVLSLVRGKVPLLIEIKDLKNIKLGCSKIYNLIRNYEYEIAVQSFNPFIVNWFAKNAPDIIRGQLSSSYKDQRLFSLWKYLLKRFFFNFITRPDFVAFNIQDMPNKKVIRLRKGGMIVLGWTVRSYKESEFAAQFCDNIIFENITP